MSNLRTIHNAITGEITTIELTEVELAERAQLEKDAKTQVEAKATKEAARKAVLAKLGLSAEEAAALLG
jgi:hypothetical protein